MKVPTMVQTWLEVGGALVNACLRATVAAATMAMMLITVVDVVGRYLLNSPLSGANELVEMTLGLAIMSGMPLVSMQGSHISVSMIEGLRSRPWYGALQAFIEFFCLACSVLIAYALWKRTGHLMETLEHTSVLRVTLWPMVAGLSALWVAVAAAHADTLFRARKAPPVSLDVI
jgi:TRAP-type C4-dicarboxylate transport system permease small subunit